MHSLLSLNMYVEVTTASVKLQSIIVISKRNSLRAERILINYVALSFFSRETETQNQVRRRIFHRRRDTAI